MRDAARIPRRRADRQRRGRPDGEHAARPWRPRRRLRDPPRRDRAKVPCITTLSGASAAVQAIARAWEVEPQPLQELNLSRRSARAGLPTPLGRRPRLGRGRSASSTDGDAAGQVRDGGNARARCSWPGRSRLSIPARPTSTSRPAFAGPALTASRGRAPRSRSRARSAAASSRSRARRRRCWWAAASAPRCWRRRARLPEAVLLGAFRDAAAARAAELVPAG